MPPPEQVSHDSHPDICSMLLMVVPAGAAVGLGDGLGLPPEEGGGGVGGVLVGVDPGAVVEEGGGAELVAGAGAVVAVLSGVEVLPPHPATASRSVPETQLFRSVGGTIRISRL